MLLFPLIESRILLVISVLLLLLFLGLIGLNLDKKYLIWFCGLIKQKDKLI